MGTFPFAIALLLFIRTACKKRNLRSSSAQLIAGCSSLDENISFYKACRVELLSCVRSSREKSYSRFISLNSVPFESYFHFILLEQNLTILISFLSKDLENLNRFYPASKSNKQSANLDLVLPIILLRSTIDYGTPCINIPISLSMHRTVDYQLN